jgi:hypothetical protein
MLSPANQATKDAGSHRIEVDHGRAAAARRKRPAGVTMNGWISAEVDDKASAPDKGRSTTSFHREQADARPTRRGSPSPRLRNRSHRSDRQVDAAGENDEGRCHRGDGDESDCPARMSPNTRVDKSCLKNPSGYEHAEKTTIVARSGRYFSFILASRGFWKTPRADCPTATGGR